MRTSRPRAQPLGAALAALAACTTTPNPEYCDDQKPCTDIEAPYCDINGQYEGSPNTCIAVPFDASSSPPNDASTDAAAGTLDASPLQPPVTNNQPANLVLGVSTFFTGGGGSPALTSLRIPRGVASCGDQLWIADGGNHRVLVWNEPPTMNQAPADFVVGQAASDENAPGTTSSSLNFNPAFADVYCDGTHLLVGDSQNHRVLVWTSLPTATGQAANIVLGQTNFTSNASGSGANQMKLPGSIWTDGTTLLVSDAGNNRVLVWTSFPTTNGAAADLVLGQTGFGVSGAASPPTASSLNSPRGIHFDGSRLYVADGLNNRVLAWNGIPTSSGQPADMVIGQPDLESADPHGGEVAVHAGGLFYPDDVFVAFDSLFVSDYNNNRVVVYTPVPTVPGRDASAVLGQANLNENLLEPSTPTQRSLWNPRGLEVVGNQLYVSGNWDRVLRFTLSE